MIEYSPELKAVLSTEVPEPILFPFESLIRHKKTGGVYEVRITPDVGRLEATNTPAYAYRSLDSGLVWFRSQEEIEDGRFELTLRPVTALGQ